MVKRIAVQLATSLAAVLGLYTLLWLPLATVASSAEVSERALGSPSAPVTIIEYASLTCPHCADFHEQVFPEIKQRYVETGKVRFVYRDFPLDQKALLASALAHCAGPDRYFNFLDVLYDNQEALIAAADPVAYLVRLGQLGGLKGEEAEACLADEQLLNSILQTRLEGQNAHDVRSTPSFVIDGETYAGGRDVEAFAELIEPLLPES